MKKLEVGKAWLWAGAVAYLIYSLALLLPLFLHIYALAVLGANTAISYEQVQAMKILVFLWLVGTAILFSIAVFASQFITVK